MKLADDQIHFETVAEAREKYAAWIDSIHEETVKKIASQWLTDDGVECDGQQFQLELAQLRASIAQSRAQCLAEFEHNLEQLLRVVQEREQR
jgi:hypothetical protein